jgi:Tol biopolymer transport system component
LVIASLDGSSEIIELEPRRFQRPRWSPDGSRILYSGSAPGEGDDADPNVYVYDVELETAPRRLTDEGDNREPVWSPDGDRFVFSSDREGTEGLDLFVRRVDSDEAPTLVLSLPGSQSVTDWPADDLLVVESGGPSGILLVQLGDSVQWREYYAPEADVDDARVSPDGTLAAYASDESGRDEVYIKSFPDPRTETAVSEGGGRLPHWSPDGRTLYYHNLGGDTIYAARIQYEPTTAVLSRGIVRMWPHIPFDRDLHPDGDRFIAVRIANTGEDSAEAGEAPAERHFIVTNWFKELRERTGGSGDER